MVRFIVVDWIRVLFIMLHSATFILYLLTISLRMEFYHASLLIRGLRITWNKDTCIK